MDKTPESLTDAVRAFYSSAVTHQTATAMRFRPKSRDGFLARVGIVRRSPNWTIVERKD